MIKRALHLVIAGLLVLTTTACQQPSAANAPSSAAPSREQPSSSRANLQVASSHRPVESVLWQAPRYEAIQQAAQQADAQLGILMLASTATQVCSADTADMQRFFSERFDDSDTVTSLAELRRFQGQFCPPGIGPDLLEAHTQEIQRRVEAGDAEARLISVLLDVDDEMAATDRASLRLAAMKMSATTRSPSVYEALQISLLEDPLFDQSETGRRPFGMDDATLREAWGYAVLLASCERFGHCGAGSLHVFRMCMPHHCRPGLDGRGYVRDRLSRDAFEEAQRRAQRLLAQR